MQAICTTSGKPFTISEAEAQYCRDHNIPLPKIHPHERLKKILSFRNRTFLYNVTCAFSHKPILSQIPPERGFTIYDNDIWNSDQWDPLAYGQSYDPSRPFFEQFAELLKKVPLPNLTIVRSSTVNSEYVNGAANLKNCYLTFASTFLEDCMFCWNSFECKNIVDCISTAKSELCYDCRSIENCYRVQHADSCSNCSDSYFLENCKSCKNCYGCVNLNNKEYCWFNEQLTQSDFNKRIAELELGSYEVRKAEKAKFATFKKNLPRKYLEGTNNESCTGNCIHNCKDCRDVFHSTGAVDVETSIAANKCKDTFSVAYCISSELTYNTYAGIGHYNIQFCGECIQLKDSMYCLYCIQGCSDCFGCVGLKKKQYCILQ